MSRPRKPEQSMKSSPSMRFPSSKLDGFDEARFAILDDIDDAPLGPHHAARLGEERRYFA